MKSSQASMQLVRKHLASYGLFYGLGALVFTASVLATHLYLDRSNGAASSGAASAVARQAAAGAAAGIENMSPQQLTATLQQEFMRQHARVPQFGFDEKSLSTATFDARHFGAAPQVAQQTAELNRSLANFPEQFKRIADAAASVEQAGAPIQGDVSALMERFNGAAADRLRAARSQVVTSVNVIDSGRYDCSFSASNGAGLSMLSGQGATLEEACRAAVNAPDSEIKRLDQIPQEQR